MTLVKRENQDHQARVVHLERRDVQEKTDQKETWAPSVLLETPDHVEKLEFRELMEYQEKREMLERLVILDHPDLKGSLDQMVHQVEGAK